MRVLRFVKSAAVALACLNLAIPLQQLNATPPLTNAPVGTPTGAASAPIHDIALDGDGTLSGHVLDHLGKPRANQTVLVLQGQTPIRTVSDNQGRFVVSGIPAGVCHVASGNSVTLCRCWAAGTAPPVAQKRVLLVSDGPVERGQRPIGEVLGNPLLIGLIIAAAIAIPIAVHNSKKDAS